MKIDHTSAPRPRAAVIAALSVFALVVLGTLATAGAVISTCPPSLDVTQGQSVSGAANVSSDSAVFMQLVVGSGDFTAAYAPGEKGSPKKVPEDWVFDFVVSAADDALAGGPLTIIENSGVPVDQCVIQVTVVTTTTVPPTTTTTQPPTTTTTTQPPTTTTTQPPTTTTTTQPPTTTTQPPTTTTTRAPTTTTTRAPTTTTTRAPTTTTTTTVVADSTSTSSSTSTTTSTTTTIAAPETTTTTTTNAAPAPTSPPTTTIVQALPPPDGTGGGGGLSWLWLPIAAAAMAAGAWFLAMYRRAQAVPAGAGSQIATGGAVVSLPLRQRIRAAMSPGTHKVRGPGLWQRIRLSGFGRALFTRTHKPDKVPLSYRIRNSRAAAKVKTAEAAASWRSRRAAKDVQRRIRERHPDS